MWESSSSNLFGDNSDIASSRKRVLCISLAVVGGALLAVGIAVAVYKLYPVVSSANAWKHYCDHSPCANGGMCNLTVFGGFVCTCAHGYTGVNCSSLVNGCDSRPCVTGLCMPALNTYTCLCQPGHTGSNCATVIDNCASSPCLNNGECINGVQSFSCTCTGGYTGITCGIVQDLCASGPCLNGGLCTKGIGTFTCACAQGYSGDTCIVVANNCAGKCQNGATCVNSANSFSCVCIIGYTGATCQSLIDNCVSLPCTNGATCVNSLNTYTCVCVPGSTGNVCQTTGALDAFYAAVNRTTMYFGTTLTTPGPPPYTSGYATGSSQFNMLSYNMTVLVPAYYWMHLAAEVPSNFHCAAVIVNIMSKTQPANTAMISIQTTGVIFGQATVSRDLIVSVIPGQKLTVQLSSYLAPSSQLASVDEPMWMGFRLDNIFAPTSSYFLVNRTSSTKSFLPVTDSTNQQVVFDNIVTNVMNGWNGGLNVFIAPQDGVYLFSFTAGYQNMTAAPPYYFLRVRNANSSSSIRCTMAIGAAPFTSSSLTMPPLPNVASGLASRTCLVLLNAQDSVSIETNATANIPLTAAGLYQTTFSGVQYSLNSPLTQVAWSLYASRQTAVMSTTQQFIMLQPVFQVGGQFWDLTTNTQGIIRIRGVYFLTVNFVSCGNLHSQLVVELKVNNVPVFRVNDMNQGEWPTTRSQSTVRYLNAGDQLVLDLPGNGVTPNCYNGYDPTFCTFSGFYIGPPN